MTRPGERPEQCPEKQPTQGAPTFLAEESLEGVKCLRPAWHPVLTARGWPDRVCHRRSFDLRRELIGFSTIQNGAHRVRFMRERGSRPHAR
jgi:hypothetical protein